MSSDLTTSDVLIKIGLAQNSQTDGEFTTAGVIPELITAEMKKTVFVLGVTIETFKELYSSVEFDFQNLMETFKTYCKDFLVPLEAGVPSKALEFSAKMLFEFGPYIRNEKKSKGDKAIRFKFPYNKTVVSGDETTNELCVKTVIVSTFKDIVYKNKEEGSKMILTFKQAGMLAMVTFLSAVEYIYSQNEMTLMTPLCGAVFSRDSIKEMASSLNKEEVAIIKMINASSATGGQYLPESDLACAVVCTISTTKRVTNKDVRSQMITKIIKQYSSKHKQYEPKNFSVFAKHALGGVPPGMDAETMIENFSNIQISEVTLRAQALASKQPAYTRQDPLVSNH